jgi:hypothetical protein
MTNTGSNIALPGQFYDSKKIKQVYFFRLRLVLRISLIINLFYYLGVRLSFNTDPIFTAAFPCVMKGDSCIKCHQQKKKKKKKTVNIPGVGKRPSEEGHLNTSTVTKLFIVEL